MPKLESIDKGIIHVFNMIQYTNTEGRVGGASFEKQKKLHKYMMRVCSSNHAYIQAY